MVVKAALHFTDIKTFHNVSLKNVLTIFIAKCKTLSTLCLILIRLMFKMAGVFLRKCVSFVEKSVGGNMDQVVAKCMFCGETFQTLNLEKFWGPGRSISGLDSYFVQLVGD